MRPGSDPPRDLGPDQEPVPLIPFLAGTRTRRPAAPRRASRRVSGALALAALLALGALPGAARDARADEGLFLTWDDCEPGGTHDEAFDCGSNGVTLSLYCAFSTAVTTGADVLSLEAVVDVQHSLATLPDWWRMSAGGGECRSGQLLASADFTANNSCADPWSGLAAAEVQGYVYGEPHGLPSQVRIKVVSGVKSANARTLVAGVQYYGMKLLLSTDRSGGSFACAGCSAPACLVLNSILVRRLPGSPGGDLFLTIPGPGNANRATWRGGAGADCVQVPARRTTWGSIKSLYR